MIQGIAELDKKGYRNFGLTMSAILIVLFGLVIPFLFTLNYPKWPWVLGAIITTWCLVAPLKMRPLYDAWMKFGMVMNWINTRLILGLLFFGIILPFGIGFKLLGKDPMRRKIDKNLESYREPADTESKCNLENPY